MDPSPIISFHPAGFDFPGSTPLAAGTPINNQSSNAFESLEQSSVYPLPQVVEESICPITQLPSTNVPPQLPPWQTLEMGKKLASTVCGAAGTKCGIKYVRKDGTYKLIFYFLNLNFMIWPKKFELWPNKSILFGQFLTGWPK